MYNPRTNAERTDIRKDIRWYTKKYTKYKTF